MWGVGTPGLGVAWVGTRVYHESPWGIDPDLFGLDGWMEGEQAKEPI